MRLNFVHLCDYAIVANDGKLSVLGIFGNINVDRLPAVYAAPVVLALQLEISPAEVGSEFAIMIKCADQDGNKLFEVKGNLKTAAAEGKTVKPGDRPQFNQVIRIPSLKLERPGPHEVDVLVNGEHRGGVRFDVTVLPSQPETGRQG